MKFTGKSYGLLLLLMLLICIPIRTQAADKAPPKTTKVKADKTPPKITKVKIVNPNVQTPGILNVDVTFVEEGSGIDRIHIDCRLVGENIEYSYCDQKRDGVYDLAAPQSGTIRVPVRMHVYPEYGKRVLTAGKWIVSRIEIYDKKGNKQSILYKWNDATMTAEGIEIKNNGTVYQGDYGFRLKTPAFTVKDEFDAFFDTNLKNPKLVKIINDMPEHKTLKILFDKHHYNILPKAVFDSIKGKDKTILLYTNGGYQWIFNGKDITKPTRDVNLFLYVSRISGAPYGASAEISQLIFHASGTLPGKARIRIKSPYLYNIGKKGTLYLYDQNGDRLVREAGNFKLAADGMGKWCHIDITHYSTYFISNQKLTLKKEKKQIPASYKVTYKKNGATGGKVPAADKAKLDTKSKKYRVTAAGNTGKLVRKGYIFAGWNTKANGMGTNYKKNSTLLIKNKNIVLYAKWNKARLTASSRTVKIGKKLTLTAAREKGSAIRSVKWSASNKKITFKADKTKCTITGRKRGTSTLKAVITFTDGSKQTLTRQVSIK